MGGTAQHNASTQLRGGKQNCVAMSGEARYFRNKEALHPSLSAVIQSSSVIPLSFLFHSPPPHSLLPLYISHHIHMPLSFLSPSLHPVCVAATSFPIRLPLPLPSPSSPTSSTFLLSSSAIRPPLILSVPFSPSPSPLLLSSIAIHLPLLYSSPSHSLPSSHYSSCMPFLSFSHLSPLLFLISPPSSLILILSRSFLFLASSPSFLILTSPPPLFIPLTSFPSHSFSSSLCFPSHFPICHPFLTPPLHFLSHSSHLISFPLLS